MEFKNSRSGRWLEAAGNALHYAVNMARNHGSSITLISVVDANDLLRETNDVMLTDEFMETLKVEGKEIVAQAARTFRKRFPMMKSLSWAHQAISLPNTLKKKA